MPTQNNKFMNNLFQSRTSAGQVGADLEVAWRGHQALMGLLDELEGLNAVLDLMPESPESSRAIDRLDDAVEAAREVIDSTDVVEVALGIEDELLEPSDYEDWPAEDEE